MDPVEITLLIENERKKCLNIIKKYYNKHGNESIEKLYNYLQSQIENTDDSVVRTEIGYDMEILKDYLKQSD